MQNRMLLTTYFANGAAFWFNTVTVEESSSKLQTTLDKTKIKIKKIKKAKGLWHLKD